MSDPSKEIEEKCKELETQISSLRNEINLCNASNLDESDPALAPLVLENTKLKTRLAVLKRAIQKERTIGCGGSERVIPQKFDTLISITSHLADLFAAAILLAYPNVSDVPAIITQSNNSKFGDYQCNSSLPIAKKLKNTERPAEVAKNIVNALGQSPILENVDIAPAGFINIFIKKEYAKLAIKSILIDGPKAPKVKKLRVLIDFSSPNIAKEMHVGHLRSTIIGESISRLLEFLGHHVIRINHLGDWGTQFGMLIAHLMDLYPNFDKESPSISDLNQFYKQSKVRFDEDEEFKKRAYECVVNLQSGEERSTKGWELICEESRKEFQKIYDRLDVTLIPRGESFYQSRMIDIVAWLESKGYLEEDDGRKIMWGSNKNGIPLTIVKSGGGFTYDTSDMAAIKQRIEEEKSDWLLYVVDAGQGVHLRTIFDCAIVCGILKPEEVRVDHVAFGLVLGDDGKKFKTRSGDTVKLNDLLEEGMKRALDKLKEKGRDEVLNVEELEAAQTSVAYGCIKYADLSHNRVSDYAFNFDKMLDDKGNTAVYLLYAYTRIKSIARNCGASVSDISKLAKEHEITLDHEKEWKLAKVLLKFHDVIIKFEKELFPHYLCEYVYEIATTFSEFYDSCYCIEKNKQGEILKYNYGRILLSEAAALILGKCFDILGLKPITKI